MKTCFTIGIAALVLLSIIASATSQGTSPSPAPDNSTTCSEECHDYAECYNNYCTCIYGFTGNGTYCEAIPCYNNPCDENAYCLDQGNGSSTCNCQYGYTGNGTVCTSLCSEDCGRNAYCTRNYTSYYGNEYVCQCNYGYTGDPTDYCYDIDECDYVNCTEYATCYNTNGSYVCECDPGFTGYGGYYCYAIPPCYNNPCDENAYCSETINGSYTCHCQYTYTGNGTVCTSLCSEDCGRNAYCTRNYTSYDGNEYVCQCNYGYTGDPTDYCYDIDECATGEYCQIEYAYCSNTEGSFTCICSRGYYYSRILQECIEIDSDEPYRAEAVVVPGCDESANENHRRYLQYKVEALVSEYFYATSQYDSEDGSGDDSRY